MTVEEMDLLAMAEREMMDGYGDVCCDVCGAEYRVEPDASFPCLEEGCEGMVESASMRLGVI